MLPATKDELAGLINSLGVPLASDTKLSDAELERRLRDALDSAQYLNKVFPGITDGDSPIDLKSMAKYTPKSRDEITKDLQRITMRESQAFAMADRLGKPQSALPGQEAYFELRQTILSLGQIWAESEYTMIIQNAEQTSSMCIRLIEVREAAPNTPLIILLYSHDIRDRSPPIGLAWVQRHISAGRTPRQIRAALQEQQLLLRVLQSNSERLPQSYSPSRKPDERRFTLSFLLPMGAIESVEIGKFVLNACAVCTERATATCGACRAVYYCGPEHAKKDWRSHKPVCRPLMKASWDKLKFCNRSQGPIKGSDWGGFTSINHLSPIQHSGLTYPADKYDDTSPPPNIHASSPFLAKMQMGTVCFGGVNRPRCFLSFYDEERTLWVHSLREECEPQLWEKLDSILARLGSLDGVKLFVWARRTGEWELSVTLDPLPAQNFPW